MKRVTFNIVGALLAFGGLVWFLQGIGTLESAIVGEELTLLTIMGFMGMLIGGGLLVYTNSRTGYR